MWLAHAVHLEGATGQADFELEEVSASENSFKFSAKKSVLLT
jgi:hypothetical protein